MHRRSASGPRSSLPTGAGLLLVLAALLLQGSTAAQSPATVFPRDTSACTIVGSAYPFLLDPASNISVFPSPPAIANTSGGIGVVGNSTVIPPPPPTASNGTPPPNGTSVPAPPPPPPWGVPQLPNLTYGEVARLFLEVCVVPGFATLLADEGVQNFSFGASGTTRPDALFVFFGFTWANQCPAGQFPGAGECAYQEYWTANASDGSVSGPVQQVGPAAFNGPGGPALSSAGPPTSFLGIPAGWGIALGLWLAGASVVAAAVLVERRRPGSTPPPVRPPSA